MEKEKFLEVHFDMSKKNLIIVGVVAVVGFIAWKKFHG